jgi:hypothetical protein
MNLSKCDYHRKIKECKAYPPKAVTTQNKIVNMIAKIQATNPKSEYNKGKLRPSLRRMLSSGRGRK